MFLTSGWFLGVALPACLVGFLLLRRWAPPNYSLWWLCLCSILLYEWWDPTYLPLLLGSLVANYFVGSRLVKHRGSSSLSKTRLLGGGIALNLFVLGYYKYATFTATIVNDIAGTAFVSPLAPVPLGISFLTFLQIAYLVDLSRSTLGQPSWLDYTLFVTFFPKLIAGPILRQEQFLPQIDALRSGSFSTAIHLVEGISYFAIGLAKKLVLADSFSPLIDPTFASLASGSSLSMAEAWLAVLAYTFQLYFDFSGYTDMAIGIARMFGFTLPENFQAPYKATSIIDFWRRWHITFSLFLRDYLYFPLGGNRKGALRQYVNLFVIMILGGLWHGANWTFVVWGGLHGFYLCINHLWRKLQIDLPDWLCHLLTSVSIVLAWGWFRADTIPTGLRLSRALVGLTNVLPPNLTLTQAKQAIQTPAPEIETFALVFHDLSIILPLGSRTIYPMDILTSNVSLTGLLFLVATIVAWRGPTTQEWVQGTPALQSIWTLRRAAIIGLLLYGAFLASINADHGAFIYQQF